MLYQRTWGDDIFGGFPRPSDEEVAAKRLGRIESQINEIIDREKVTYPEMIEIIERKLK